MSTVSVNKKITIYLITKVKRLEEKETLGQVIFKHKAENIHQYLRVFNIFSWIVTFTIEYISVMG